MNRVYMHHSSMKLMMRFRDRYLGDMLGSTVLDIGARSYGGHDTYRSLFEPNYRYTAMDVEPGENVDIVGYENIRDVYDVLISGQTMEHVNHPWDWLKSLVPYFRKYICIIAPHIWREHRFPVDTYRYLPDGMLDLFNYAGIKGVEVVKNQNDTMAVGTK